MKPAPATIATHGMTSTSTAPSYGTAGAAGGVSPTSGGDAQRG
jgi:hypothetical protein